MIRKPWEMYRFGKRSQAALDSVLHVTHIDAALSVLAKESIEPQLISDESVLNKRRIQVVWLSPNRWNAGFRYGHIAFRFDWKKVLAKRRVYWVEAVTKYNPTACRFLLTNVNRATNPYLVPYDPDRDDGPWRFAPAKGQHFWNHNLTMEFMLEGALDLEDCTETEFVSHHPRMCSNGGSCREQQMPAFEAGARFVAGAVSRELEVSLLHMTEERSGKTRGTSDLLTAVEHLLEAVRKCPAAGALRQGSSRATIAARAVLLAYSNRNRAEFRAAVSLFNRSAECATAIESLLGEAFDADRVRL